MILPRPSLLRHASPAWVMGVLLVAAACSDEPAGPDPIPQPVGSVLGQVSAPGFTAFAHLTAHVTWGAVTESSPVEADGTFEVPIFEDVSGFGTLTVVPGASAGVHPAYVLLAPGDLDSRGQIVMVPDTWTLTAGEYSGAVVPIDPDLAADSKIMPSFWGFFFPFRQQGSLQIVTNSSLWTGEFRTWRDERYPIPVAFDHDFSHASVNASDSASFWAHVELMEEALGRDVFVPASVDDLVILGGARRARNGVLVTVDTTLAVEGYGDPNTPDAFTWLFAADADTWSGSLVTRVEVSSSDMNGARIFLRDGSLLSDRRTVIHELMHVLGAGHGCGWPSVQTYCASLATDVPTPADVAHLEVLEAMRAMEEATRSRWGIMSAVFGQRAVTLGQAVVPPPNVVYGPGS